jgi:type I restriction enzyme S subunit
MRAETTFDRRVTKDDFRDIPIPVPPRRVQEQISVALDAETTRIDALIEKKRRMVEVLREQRRGLITATVTGDRADEFSESPGDADAWPSYRLKFLVGINERTLTEDCHPDYEFRYVDIGLVGRGSLVNDEPVLLRFGDAPSRARRILRRGDTIISTVRTYLRAVWSVAGQWDAPLVASTGFAVLSPGPKLDADYLGWWAQSDACIDNVVARSTGVSYPALSANEIGNLTIALPPLSDQRRLAALLAARVSQIDSLISTLNLQVDLLLDYRQTLITRVVTGQLDLAEAA